MTVSQAREVYPSTRGGAGGVGGAYDKALVPVDTKLKERTFHYLQVCASLHADESVCPLRVSAFACVLSFIASKWHSKETGRASAYPHVKTLR